VLFVDKFFTDQFLSSVANREHLLTMADQEFYVRY